MYTFENAERFDIAGRGPVFSVENPAECKDFKHLINTEVSINGELWLVRGVEYRTHGGPQRAGAPIGLLVSKVT